MANGTLIGSGRSNNRNGRSGGSLSMRSGHAACAAAAMQAEWPARVESEPPLRPLRLFDKPEPIKVPFATVPDGPPHQFTWRRALHAVVRVEGPERIAMEWWRQDGKQLTRDYFRIEDAEGLRFWIFRDGLYEGEVFDADGKPASPNWYVHGLFA